MREIAVSAILLLVLLAAAAWAADPVTVQKTIPASAGPWAVTLSINANYPYGGGHSAPVLFSAADGFGFRAGDVLTIRYAAGMWCNGTMVTEGTCVDANGYRNHVANDQPGCASGRYFPSRYIPPASYPVHWMELVGTFADDRGQIAGTPFKIGNGPVSVTVPGGATRLQLGANYCDYSTTRNFFTPLSVTVAGPPPPTMNVAGSMAQLASGGPWKTTLVLVNTGTRPALARLDFFDDRGRALPLPVAFPETPGSAASLVSTLERTLGAGASLVMESEDRANPTRVGWAQLVTDGDLSGFAVFGTRSGNYDQEAVVPLETRNARTYVIWYNNTGGLVTGVALANVSAQALTVAVTIRDEAGTVIGTDAIPLEALGHTAFEMPRRLPLTAQRRGTVEFEAPAGGRISVLGLRFNPLAFTTIPVLAR